MTTTERKDAVAATIKAQIGFWALAEVGARGFLFDTESLYFDCKPKSRIVRVVVTLDPFDVYNVRVLSKKTWNVLYQIDGAYAEDLPEIIRNLARHL